MRFFPFARRIRDAVDSRCRSVRLWPRALVDNLFAFRARYRTAVRLRVPFGRLTLEPLETRELLAASTTTVLTPTAGHVADGQAVALTAVVASTAGTPSGTVTLYDDSSATPTVVGTAALVNGTASFAGVALADGVHPPDANYGGTASFAGSDG
jgi:hypothetical protein